MALQLSNDQGTVLTTEQTVNVGEHVRLTIRDSDTGALVPGAIWVVTGTHIRDWVTKDALNVPMTVDDYIGSEIWFTWKDVTSPTAPNTVRATALVSGVLESVELEFSVERDLKPEKFYSDDLLMEYHNNWHSVYRFSDESVRRGDLFLAWHRSQLDYFNQWRSYFGYGAVPNWDPTMAWITSPVPESKQHPASPEAGFSTPESLVTLDLSADGLQTPSLGEYDLQTDALSRGTTSQFESAGYVLNTATVSSIAGIPGTITEFSFSGVADLPPWYTVTGGTSSEVDPWFANGCPVNWDGSGGLTCTVSTKRGLVDYSLRELGESIESGWYLDAYRVNYHALGHVAASGDMGDPRTSMRDPIFWAWHSHIDALMAAWQSTQTDFDAEGETTSVYQNPSFDSTWSTLRVAFQRRMIPDFVKASHVEVNGSPATAVTDESFTGTGYIFDFTGFAVPSDGTIEVVIRRDADTGVRTSTTEARPAVGLLVSTFGQLFAPHIQAFYYTK
jgi:hypothetical protein